MLWIIIGLCVEVLLIRKRNVLVDAYMYAIRRKLLHTI